MLKDIYEPLTEYINVFRERFKKVAEETFVELAAEAQVDIEANRETCRQLYKSQATLSSVKNRISCWTTWCVVLWISVIAGIILSIYKFEELSSSILISIGTYEIIAIVYLLMKVHPRLKQLKVERDSISSIVNNSSFNIVAILWGKGTTILKLPKYVVYRMLTIVGRFVTGNIHANHIRCNKQNKYIMH